MKKQIYSFLLASLLLAAPAAAMADAMAPAGPMAADLNRAGRNQIGLDLAGAIVDKDISDALYVGGDWSYGVNDWFAIGAEAGWEGTDFDFGDEDLDIVTVFGDLIARGSVPGWAAVPYGVIGFGVLHASSDVENFDSDDTSFAMKFGAGLDWFLTRNWLLNFEVAYIATGGDLPASNGVTEDLDHWRIGGGLKYAF